MAKNRDKNTPDAPVQGDFATFSGFEEKCGSKSGKGKAGK
jgi:hypothetical protein